MVNAGCNVSTPEALADSLLEYNAEHPEVVSRVAQCEREFALYKRHSPPLDRGAVRLNATLMKPHEWWELYCEHLPLLSSVATRVLAQVASAFAAERNWSVYGQIKNDRMLRMHHHTADARVYAHEALQLHDKLRLAQDATCDYSEPDGVSDSEGEDESDGELEVAKLMR